MRRIIPQGLDYPIALLDACIVFFPQHFVKWPSLKNIEKQLSKIELFDFDLDQNVPEGWENLRQEALSVFRELFICEAWLKPLDLKGFSI